MRIISWNLNGLPTKIERGDFAPIVKLSPDIICLQEIRTQQESIIIEQYHHYWNHGQVDGYFGTAFLCRQEPFAVIKGLLNDSDKEGRAMTVELPKCYLVNLYVPNSQRNLRRHQYRLKWDARLAEYIHNLQERKPVILCGDFNTTLSELDVYAQNER